MLKKLMKKEEGFTLAELLIVVAIIAVLVAVSIPIFTAQLEKSRESTDMANLRAAKAAAVSALLTDEGPLVTVTNGTRKLNTCYYDAPTGTLVGTEPTTGCGKGTNSQPNSSYDEYKQYGYDGTKVAGENIVITADDDNGTIKISFANQIGAATVIKQ